MRGITEITETNSTDKKNVESLLNHTYKLSQNLTPFCSFKCEAKILHNVKLTYAGFSTLLANGFGYTGVLADIY